MSNKSKKNKALKAFIIVLLIIAVLLGTFTFLGIAYIKKNFNYKYNEITSDPEELGFEEVKRDEIINIALFGVDTRNEKSFKGNTDSIMILSVNTTEKKVKIISVLRDTFVPIPKDSGTAHRKINSLYAVGGPEYAIKMINSYFALDISEYATVNFNGMAEIIDAVGGIDVVLTEDELPRINSSKHEQAKKYGGKADDYLVKTAGNNHLNGVQAVAYSRIRYVSNSEGTANDYGRTDRQRYIMEQLFNKAITMDKTQYVDLIRALSPYCETSLSFTEILNLAVKVLLNKPTFEQTRVPFIEYTMPAPTTAHGSIVYYDLEFAANIIHAFIYDNITPQKYIEANGISKNDWYRNGYNPPVIKENKPEESSKKESKTPNN